MKKSGKYIIAIVVGLFLISNVFGQRENNKDQTLRGSGRVNPSTLAMEFDLPLGSYPGRGINVPISLSYSSKVWRMDYSNSFPRVNNPSSCIALNHAVFAENSASGWTTSLAVPYIEYVGRDNIFNSNGLPFNIDCETSQTNPQYFSNAIVKRLVVHLPSGETHELRADDTYVTYDPTQPPPTYIWDTTFYAVDSSNIKYIENSSTNTYKLLMPDGSYYEFAGSLTSVSTKTARKAIKYYDRNGNFTTYNDNARAWTDTLGRTLNTPLGLDEPASPTTQTYSMPGMTGTYKFVWKQLKGSSAAESSLTNFNQDLRYRGNRYILTNANGSPYWAERPAGTYLFGSEWEAYVLAQQLFNPIVLTEIELPTGQKYKFSYNIYGMIEKIQYPTGGEEQFTYGQVAPLSMPEPGEVSAQANFGVVDRKVLKTSGDTSPYQWTYGAVYVAPGGYKVTVNNPDNTKIERFLYQSNAAVPGATTGSFGYDNGLAGMSYEERAFDSLGNLVSKNLKHWEVTSFSVFGGSQPAHWHPRVTHEENYIYDSSGNGVYSTTKFEYEGDLSQRENPVLQKKVLEYGFTAISGNSIAPTEPGQNPNPVPTPVPTPVPANLIRTTESTFLINDSSIVPAIRDNYKNQNMVGLVTASIVKDASGNPVSRSEMKYDDSGFSPTFRGNPTTSRVWDSSKGTWDNANAYITTRARFDIYGNQYEAIDAKGNSTLTAFDSVYQTFPIQVTTVAPDPSGQNGSNTGFTTTSTFDPTTGLPLTTTDANGLETRIEYDPVTLRPLNTKTFYQNTQVGSMSETIYNDQPNNYWVKSRSQIDVNKWAESITYYDGLGRAYKSEEVNSKGNIFVEKEFDAEGRVKRVTNPFRANETKYWTTNVYDNSSRVIEVVTADNAKVKTDYGVSVTGAQIGTTMTVTDQAGKQRRSLTNALGQLVRVDEPNEAGQLGTVDAPTQPTYYAYDILNNLLTVNQGVQTRSFVYDSLSRLKSANNPESGIINYNYDDNGNLIQKTDARQVVTNYVYDALNRVTNRNYSAPQNLPNYQATPNVAYTYDNLPNAKGKLIRVDNGFSKTEYQEFDLLGRVKKSQQTTDGTAYNPMEYVYNLSGALVEQKYPSGRVVRNVLDNDGELSMVQSKRNANAGFLNYARAFTYTAAGAVSCMQLGNGSWESTQFNARLQPVQIALGSVQNATNKLKLDFDYGTVNNNGNVLSQTITAPSETRLGVTYNAFTAVQTYTYDSLNRIKDAKEMIGASQQWKQTFQYDRYGNRQFDTGTDANGSKTTTLPQNCPTAVCNPQIDPATNKLVGYEFDAVGNIVQDAEGNRFRYNVNGQQTEFFDPINQSNEPSAKYYYDGEGLRVKKVIGSKIVIFIYDLSRKIVAEYTVNISAPTISTISYITSDSIASPRLLTDSNGEIISRRDFMPFGEEITSSHRSQENRYYTDNISEKFTTYERDNETESDYAQTRYYKYQFGRFSSPDPFNIILEKDRGRNNKQQVRFLNHYINQPQNWNKYIYVINNPINLMDPLGLIWLQNREGIVTWVDNDEYKNNRDKYKDHRPLAPGTVIKVGKEGTTGIYVPYIGKQVVLLENGRIEELPPDTVNVYAADSTENQGIFPLSPPDTSTLQDGYVVLTERIGIRRLGYRWACVYKPCSSKINIGVPQSILDVDFTGDNLGDDNLFYDPTDCEFSCSPGMEVTYHRVPRLFRWLYRNSYAPGQHRPIPWNPCEGGPPVYKSVIDK